MLLLTIYVFIAVGFSFLCSVAEAVILSIPMSYVVSLEQEGKKVGSILRKLKENISSPLAVILTFNTVAHTLGAAGAGAQAVAIFGSVYLGVFSAVLTLLILVLSEIIPKALGAHYWRSLAPFTAYCLHYLVIALYPFVAMSNKLTSFISHGDSSSNFNRKELAALAAIGEEEGELAKQESLVLHNLVYLNERKVKSVMTPRPVIFSVSENTSVSEYFEQHKNQRYSRIPVFDSEDKMTGFVLRSDILLYQSMNKGETRLKEIARNLEAILDEMPLLTAFDQCLSKNLHILLVVDEYGDTKGIVTQEDIIETLLGREIIDEGDRITDLQEYARKLGDQKKKKLKINGARIRCISSDLI